jgi:aspartyl/asparaginyl-tRNA synthetase
MGIEYPGIDYKLLVNAIDYYNDNGFEQIKEIPWVVSESIIKKTFNGRQFRIPTGCLVGSAEQSFLELEACGIIKQGRFFAITPCFRDEPKIDDTHFKYFMKLELISLRAYELDFLVDVAIKFHEKFTKKKIDVVKVSENQYDLEIDGIEIGSYGYRVVYDDESALSWTYGTGLALPRFDFAR